MFEKVGGDVDAHSQRKSDYAARCLFFFQLAENHFEKRCSFFNLVLASFKFSSTSLSKWLNADWTNNLRWQLFDQSGARKRRRYSLSSVSSGEVFKPENVRIVFL